LFHLTFDINICIFAPNNVHFWGFVQVRDENMLLVMSFAKAMSLVMLATECTLYLVFSFTMTEPLDMV